jgi:competence transcription factor ComK
MEINGLKPKPLTPRIRALIERNKRKEQKILMKLAKASEIKRLANIINNSCQFFELK